MGDFNAVRKLDGISFLEGSPERDASKTDFDNYLRGLRLADHSFSRPFYKWSNKRVNGFQRRKLDRILINGRWMQFDPFFSAEFMAPGVSDHCPAILRVGFYLNKGDRPSLLSAEKEKREQLMNLTATEEAALKQQSRIQWLNLGDGNNAFFQRSVKAHRARCTIRSLITADGRKVDQIEDIKSEAVNFCRNLWGSPNQEVNPSYSRVAGFLKKAN
ncbi:uncharacterized protein LOC116202266 isoform X2 [Punica granatum]|uniref:Uncharacterized protein LOC116202266 isoform X2 n=1 Tax=Punica granatum TaxID=22663 RepID=A0A6P8DE70_PUNGR|nr:uncharacterized protein LOC116202266 isoform X2 [Punica granatum]